MIGACNRSGACEWRVDEAGALAVRPAGGAPEGELGEAAPWLPLLSEILTSAAFEGRVVAPAGQYYPGMFTGCSSLAAVDLSGLDTSNMTDMRSMFYGCSSLTSLDLSPLDTSNVTDMGYMFQGSSSLTSLDLSSFDTSNVTSMGYMFQSCSSLTSLDLSGFDTTQVLSMSRMFSGCKSLREVALGERFSFEGAGSRRLCELPAIDARDVPGADGLWHDGAGRSFAPADVPSRTAATYSSVAPARSPFSDVTPSTPHAAHILWLAGEGISTGFPDGTFRPLATVKRCDMAAFLYRLAGSPAYEPSEDARARFSDVTASTPHALEVWWMADMGISTGFPDGTFRPLGEVKRCDMAAFMMRLAGGSPGAGSFSDVTASTPHAGAIAWMADQGVSTGFPDGTFRPFETVKRCDMAAFLHRMEPLV